MEAAQGLLQDYSKFVGQAKKGLLYIAEQMYRRELEPTFTFLVKQANDGKLFDIASLDKIKNTLTPGTWIIVGTGVLLVVFAVVYAIEGLVWLCCSRCCKSSQSKKTGKGSGVHKKFDDLPRSMLDAGSNGADAADDDSAPSSSTAGAQAQRFAPPPGKVLACRCCCLDLCAGEAARGKSMEELTAIHCGGKRHKKASADARAPDRALVGLIPQDEWEALQRKANPQPAQEAQQAQQQKDKAEKEEEEGLRRRAVAKPAAGSAADVAALAFRNVGGKTVAIVHNQHGIMNDIGSGAPGDSGWVSVTGSGSGAGSKGAGQASGGAGGASSKILTNLLHYEGAVNILEGLSVYHKFLTPSLEATLIDALDKTLVAGQRNALRSRFSYCPSRNGKEAASLHFGCFVDPATGKADPTKPVDSLTTPLLELSRRIIQLAKTELALPAHITHNEINCASVYFMEPGMHLAPTVTDGSVFGQPVFLIALGGDEIMTLGRRIEGSGVGFDDDGAASSGRLSSNGEFFGAHDLQLGRRSMLCLKGTVARDVQHAIPTTKGRLVLVALRLASSAVRNTLIANGNIRD